MGAVTQLLSKTLPKQNIYAASQQIKKEEKKLQKKKETLTFASLTLVQKHEGICSDHWAKSTEEITTGGICEAHSAWSEGTDDSWTLPCARARPQLADENGFRQKTFDKNSLWSVRRLLDHFF